MKERKKQTTAKKKWTSPSMTTEELPSQDFALGQEYFYDVQQTCSPDQPYCEPVIVPILTGG